MKKVMRFRNMTVPKQQGELGRFRILGGPDSGFVIVFLAPHLTIGRGEENDVVLSDLKISRRHAEITMANGAAFIRDVGSTAGLLVNGVVQKQVSLRSGDKLGFGETVIEFIASEAGATRMIQTLPARTSGTVGTGSSGLTQFIPRPGTSGMMGFPQSPTPSQTFFERNRKMILVVMALLSVAILLPSVEQKQRAKKNKYVDPKEIEAERGLASALQPPRPDDAVYDKADMYFKEGFRELREKNYLRAITAFETSLQIYADHPLSRVYLEKTRKEMEDEAKNHIVTAKKDREANRLPAAANGFNAVKRMYSRDQSNPLYKEADTQLSEVEKEIKAAKRD